jgi:hypothetical protein
MMCRGNIDVSRKGVEQAKTSRQLENNAAAPVGLSIGRHARRMALKEQPWSQTIIR